MGSSGGPDPPSAAGRPVAAPTGPAAGGGGGGGAPSGRQSSVEQCQGVVCSMKDNYGFIERADVVREIFFHYSEFRGADVNTLKLGEDVQFGVHYRNVRGALGGEGWGGRTGARCSTR